MSVPDPHKSDFARASCVWMQGECVCACVCGLRVQLLLLAARAIQTGIHSRTTAAISSQNKVIKASAKNRKNMRVCRWGAFALCPQIACLINKHIQLFPSLVLQSKENTQSSPLPLPPPLPFVVVHRHSTDLIVSHLLSACVRLALAPLDLFVFKYFSLFLDFVFVFAYAN